MVFNEQTVFWIVWSFLFVWLGVVTVFVFRMIRHYNRLATGVPEKGLVQILNGLLDNQSVLKKHIGDIARQLIEEKSIGLTHIQRIGIVRFNPFSDTGGSQSFTIAVLDSYDTGIVMTSLYGRTGNRWYVKEVKDGKGKNYDLSQEEMQAIKKARER